MSSGLGQMRAILDRPKSRTTANCNARCLDMDYTVQAGDTLWTIASRFCGDPLRWRTIAAENGLQPGSRLVVGTRLRISSQPVARVSAPTLSAAIQPQYGTQEHQPSIVPARAFLFVLADEIDPTSRKVVRKVMVNSKLAARYAAQLGRPMTTIPNPEHFGFVPTDPTSTVTLGRHALNLKPSPFMSASDHPLGAPRFSGNRYWIDIEKARSSGATFHETQEIIDDLERIAAKTRKPADLAKIRYYQKLVPADREVLIRGTVAAAAIKGPAGMALTRGLQCVQVVGFVMTAVDLGRASEKSIRVGSLKPLAAESLRQVGSWAMAWAGLKLGAAAGVAVGIETGPGAVLFAAGGALVGGVSGYLGFDWIADDVDAN